MKSAQAYAQRSRKAKRFLPKNKIKEYKERRRLAPGGKFTYRMIADEVDRSAGYVRNSLTGHCRLNPTLLWVFNILCPPIQKGDGT